MTGVTFRSAFKLTFSLAHANTVDTTSRPATRVRISLNRTVLLLPQGHGAAFSVSFIEELNFKFTETAAENSNIHLNLSEQFPRREASQEGSGVISVFLMSYKTAGRPPRGCASDLASILVLKTVTGTEGLFAGANTHALLSVVVTALFALLLLEFVLVSHTQRMQKVIMSILLSEERLQVVAVSRVMPQNSA